MKDTRPVHNVGLLCGQLVVAPSTWISSSTTHATARCLDGGDLTSAGPRLGRNNKMNGNCYNSKRRNQPKLQNDVHFRRLCASGRRRNRPNFNIKM